MNRRNYGIDLLRIVLMYLVVVQHIINLGGVIESTVFLSTKFDVIYLVNIMAVCAVNCFAIISGYVAYERKVNLKNIIKLWLRVLFYSVVLTVIVKMLFPANISIKDVLMSFFPVTNRSYWYFTAYIIMFFFTPILNLGIQKIDVKDLKKILLILIIMIAVSNVISKSKDAFELNEGYSGLWLMILYVVGAYLKKSGCLILWKKRELFAGYLLTAVVTVFVSVGAGLLSNKFLGKTVGFNCFNEYTSPTIVIESIFLVVLFSKIKVENTRIIRMIQLLAEAAFSVFLIHVHPFAKEVLFVDRFKWIAHLPIGIDVLAIISVSFLIWAVCSIVDFGRQWLFWKTEKMIIKR